MSNTGLYSEKELTSYIAAAKKETKREIAAKILVGGGIFQDNARNAAVRTARARIAAEVLEG